jgi:hypothetical protein
MLPIPREHGAYGQLAFPMLTALAAGGGSAAGWLLALACAAAFVAHEPVLVLLGQRGARARRDLGEAARRTLVAAASLAVLAAAGGAVLMPPPHRWTLLVPAAFALATVPLIVQKTQKSVTGEMHVALTLASCALPVGTAAGLRPQEAAACWLVMTMGFWAATLAVHATIARQRREPSAALRAGALAVSILSPLAAIFIANRFALHPLLWMATLPLSAMAAAVALALPHARHLRRVGWTLVAASGVTSAAILGVL